MQQEATTNNRGLVRCVPFWASSLLFGCHAGDLAGQLFGGTEEDKGINGCMGCPFYSEAKTRRRDVSH